jgi:hypothetical protein
MTGESQTISYNSRAVLLALFGLVTFILFAYFVAVMVIQPRSDIQYLSTVFIAGISGSLALGGTLISQLWGKEDISPPSIYLTHPRPGEEDIPIDTHVTATFDRLMNESTINGETFTLRKEKEKSNKEEASVKLEGGNAVLQPKVTLEPSTVYIATVTKEAKDVTGNSLAKDYTWSFTTRS